jgi:hypothetical protein
VKPSHNRDDITCRWAGASCSQGADHPGETTMFWMILLLLVMGLVFFKLGVLTVWFGVLQGLVKLLFVLSGAFLVVGAWRWVAQRRRMRTVDLRR